MRFGDAYIKDFGSSTGDVSDCDYCYSSRVSVIDADYVTIENSGILYDPESGRCISGFSYPEDAFAENDVFSEPDITVGGTEGLLRGLI